MTDLDKQMLLYGCESAELDEQIEDSQKPYMGGLPMLAMSILSDAQEVLALGMFDRNRQYINRAKYVIRQMESNDDK
tara:strand:+ start:389 stop:619 length:231 start_codon:yes stop_codon:yes gene_type:complete